MDAEELIESIIRALMFLAGMLGNNWLVICSIPRQKSTIRTNELLLINLAVSNLITNYLVDLPDTIADFAGRWFLGETFCGVFRFCADLSETSSIFTTFFICIFWHQKLVVSLKEGGAAVQMDSLSLVGGLVASSWTVAVIFSTPHFFFVAVVGGNESHEDCIDVFPNYIAHQTYEIFYLTLANAVPAAGMLFTSIQIIISLLKSNRRIQGHQSHPNKEENKSRETNRRKTDSTVCDAAPDGGVYIGEPASGQSFASPLSSQSHQAVGSAPSRPGQVAARSSPGTNNLLRAAKSVVAVASVFLVCWLTHLLLRITNNFHTSSIVVEVASYIAASYTCIIPFIFLHSIRKLSCACKR
ncbi:rhodopsin [Synchiropus picturatus]